jgi:lipoate-protein ligase B
VNELWVCQLGTLAYGEALDLQERCRDAREAGRVPDLLLLLEHPPVYTRGRRSDPSELPLGEDWYSGRGIEIVDVDRGGKVTYHGPGQLVGYPILNLAPDRKDVKRFVRDLEEVLIRALAGFGIRAERSPVRERVTSVWVGNDKIASIGIHIARWITTHGFALNVTNEPLPRFAGIVPCGITDGGVTTMERVLGRPVALADVLDPVRAHFSDVFGREIRPS